MFRAKRGGLSVNVDGGRHCVDNPMHDKSGRSDIENSKGTDW